MTKNLSFVCERFTLCEQHNEIIIIISIINIVKCNVIMIWLHLFPNIVAEKSHDKINMKGGEKQKHFKMNYNFLL